jgi:hypothetical protein
LSTRAIEIIKGFKNFAVAQATVSHILRPGNTAFKEQLKLVNGFERSYRKIHALKKRTLAKKDICPEDICPAEDVCPEVICPEIHFAQKDICPEIHLPRKTFAQKDICPEDE